jgi:hypothetical protein
MEPHFERRDLLWNMHVFTSFHAKNAKHPLSRDVLDNDVRRVFLEALGWTEDAYGRDMKGLSAKLCRKTNAREASYSGAPAREAERLGMWGSRDETRRDTHYLNTTTPFLAARGMAGTPGSDPLTLHITDWVPGAIKMPGVIPSAEDTPNGEILPSVPMVLVAELLPWSTEWYERLNDDADEAWSQEGTDERRVSSSARNLISAVILSVKVFICAMSPLHPSFPDNVLFKHILTIASPTLRDWINENNRRYLAAQEVSQVAKSLEFAGKQAEAQALRCVESQMQALSSEHKIARAEMRGEIQSRLNIT